MDQQTVAPHKVYICTNSKQMFGARLAKYAIERYLTSTRRLPVEILETDTTAHFQKFHGARFLRDGKELVFDIDDLQSFTIARFMPPKLMAGKGRALVIDPDIFALGNVSELFELDIQSNVIAACRKKDAWDTSVMLLECAGLQHWDIDDILTRLRHQTLDYKTLMELRNETSILELPRIWNSLDYLNKQTKLLHTTNRITQPWKTGLPIDFTINPMPKLFGMIPREPVHRLLGRYPTHYQPHPDGKIEQFFFSLVRDALRDGAISIAFVKGEIERKHVRRDILQHTG